MGRVQTTALCNKKYSCHKQSADTENMQCIHASQQQKRKSPLILSPLPWTASTPRLNDPIFTLAYFCSHSHTIHLWHIYLHLVDFYGFHVGKYTRTMDGMGLVFQPATRSTAKVMGGWHARKKLAQQDAASGCLSLFIGESLWLPCDLCFFFWGGGLQGYTPNFFKMDFIQFARS